MNKKIIFLILQLVYFTVVAQVEVNIDFSRNHIIGNVDSFDRSKFITIHSSPSGNDWNGELDKFDYLINGLDVYYGRDTGGLRYQLEQLDEDPNRKGFADISQMEEQGKIVKDTYAQYSKDRFKFEKNDVIIGGQDTPYYPNGSKIGNKNWSFSQTDTDEEPFGTAVGHYMGNYIENYFGNGKTSGPQKPKYLEVINEPIWPLVEEKMHGGATIDGVFEMHKSVADQVHKISADTKVGGYTTAFPDLEKRNFQQWEERWKRFIDEVGPKMDFYSIHLYDFPGFAGGKKYYRKGSHMEATMDMIEHYNTLKYGEVKPWLISEYGSQLHDWYNQPWSPYRDWLMLKAFSPMMMQLMQRSNNIIRAIPFSIAKAEWGRYSPTVPYYWRLLKQKGEPKEAKGDWEWTEIIKFYELWADVKGKRVFTATTDIDVLVDAYSNEKEHFIILNNLDDIEHTIELKPYGIYPNNIENLQIDKLYLSGDKPKLSSKNVIVTPRKLSLEPDATVILKYKLKNALKPNKKIIEQKVYADKYKQEIKAKTPAKFTISNVKVGSKETGKAVLRVGIGRNTNLTRIPTIRINGKSIKVPTDFRGDDEQKDREIFFGVLEVPVPYKFIEETNEVEITFIDEGGFISSLALQNFH